MDSQKKKMLLKAGLIALLLSSITFFTYRDALKGGLAWDAIPYLLLNPYIQSPSWANIQWMFSSFYQGNWHPLTWLSYLMDYLIYGAFWGVALTNVLLHCLNTILVFFLALVLIGLHHGRESLLQDAEPHAWVAAAVAALLFGIHPQHVESVAWLAERKDVLCQFFILMTFLCYIGYSRCRASRRRACYYGAALTCFTLALLSKPTAVTMPVLLLIIDLYPLRRLPFFDNGRRDRSGYWLALKPLLLEKLPFLALSLASVIVTLWAQKIAMQLMLYFGLELRLLNAAQSLFVYIAKWLFPINLLPLYEDFPNPNHWTSWVAVAAFFLTTVVSVALWRRRQPYWLAAWLFYVIALLPMLGIVQVGTQSSADRYAYLPTVPFYLLAGSGFAALFFAVSHRLVRVLVIAALALVSGVLIRFTDQQISIWRDDAYLWSYLAMRAPNGRAYNYLGDLYFSQGDYEKAAQYFQLATGVGRLFATSLPQKAISFLKMERWDDALSVYDNVFNTKINVKPSYSCIYYNIGLIYARKGLIGDAEKWFFKVKPDSPKEFSRAQQLLASIEKMSTDQIKNEAPTYPFCEKKFVLDSLNTIVFSNDE